jgi:hypothetical protein
MSDDRQRPLVEINNYFAEPQETRQKTGRPSAIPSVRIMHIDTSASPQVQLIVAYRYDGSVAMPNLTAQATDLDGPGQGPADVPPQPPDSPWQQASGEATFTLGLVANKYYAIDVIFGSVRASSQVET